MRIRTVVLFLSLGVSSAYGDDDFEKHVRPLLVERCVQCHGPKKSKGGLRLDSREAMLQGGDNGPAIIGGKPEESLLAKAVGYRDELRMPPKGKLADADVARLNEWIRRGAPWPATKAAPIAAAATKNPSAEASSRWWSFQPLRSFEAPAVANGVWPRSEIDRFILAKLEAGELAPSAAADRRTLLRRASFDLTGLPPTADEVDAFLNDVRPDAFAKVVDRLLASPAYGERWGRHWLDVVRYADTAGENTDHPAPQAWRYRNWVIDAFNCDQPYDQFVREQVAGDLLNAGGTPDRYASGVVATGFLAIARRFDHDSDKSMHLTHEDVIDTLGKAFLGLSISCARCHDHKYDPISARDYYALYGILQSTRFAFPGCEPKQQPRDMVPLCRAADWAEATAHNAKQLAVIDEEFRQAAAAREKKRTAATPNPRLADLRRRRADLLANPPRQQVAYAVSEGKVGDARLHLRGDPEKLGPEVPRRWLEVLGGQPIPKDAGSGRLQLAQWLSSADNPLAARVMVNRIWLHHFGKGLVQTPNDFGARGQPPTHPELLDWLARKFIASGWSVKAIHRLIMLSAVYQQACSSRPDAAERDANNDLYWRFDRRRMSAEELRDSLLTVSGGLDRAPGGPHPFPPEKTWNFTQHAPFSAIYDTDKRSVYLMTLRNRRHPFLGLFDGADPNATTPQRQVTTVPTQSLYFLNDPFFHAEAEKIAVRLLRTREDGKRLEELFRLVLQRPPTSQDRAFAMGFLQTYSKGLAEAAAADRPRLAWSAITRLLLASNEFFYLE